MIDGRKSFSEGENLELMTWWIALRCYVGFMLCCLNVLGKELAVIASILTLPVFILICDTLRQVTITYGHDMEFSIDTASGSMHILKAENYMPDIIRYCLIVSQLLTSSDSDVCKQ